MGNDVDTSVILNPSRFIPPSTHTMLTPTLSKATNVAKRLLLVTRIMPITMSKTHGVSLFMSVRAWSAEYAPINGLPP